MHARILFCSALILFPFMANAACGLFEFHGWARRENSKVFLILNEGSRSQMKFLVPREASFAINGFIDRFLNVKALVKKPIDGTAGEISEVREFSLDQPHQLGDQTKSNPLLIKESRCESK